ncbi:MAG: type II toxin-antitoxin system Phd/YefM family antitoxin [Clostridia bacterium]|nr:type II toxin-antitoxin system Phd/YefM family antitoxin [Clostridia bacterium]
MPAIRSVSDLRNDNEVLKEVDQSGMVYLTRNGSGVYAIMSIREADEYERLKATHGLSVLDRAKRRAEREGWIDEEKNVKVMALS